MSSGESVVTRPRFVIFVIALTSAPLYYVSEPRHRHIHRCTNYRT